MIENKIEELTKKPFRVALNLRRQGFYKDNLIILTKDKNLSRAIDPEKEDTTFVLRNINHGNLNIVDENGQVLYESFGFTGPTVKKIVLPNIDPEDNVSETELAFVKRLIGGSVGTIATNISRMTKVAQLISLRMEEEKRRPRPRVSILTAIDQRIEQLKQMVSKPK